MTMVKKRQRVSRRTCYGISVKIKRDNHHCRADVIENQNLNSAMDSTGKNHHLISTTGKQSQQLINMNDTRRGRSNHKFTATTTMILLITLMSFLGLIVLSTRNYCNCDMNLNKKRLASAASDNSYLGGQSAAAAPPPPPPEAGASSDGDRRHSQHYSNLPTTRASINHHLAPPSLSPQTTHHARFATSRPPPVLPKPSATISTTSPSLSEAVASGAVAAGGKVSPLPSLGTITRGHKKDQSSSNLLESLAESIERQHFKLNNPIKALVHHQQRPSKFDSGHENVIEAMPPHSSLLDAQPTQLISQRPSQKRDNQQQQQQQRQYQNSQPNMTDDMKMRQIFMLHEHAAGNSRNREPSTRTNSDLRQTKSTTGNELSKLASVWSSSLVPFLPKSFTIADSTSVAKPNELMKHVLSYLSPLGSSSTSDLTSIEEASSSSSSSSSTKQPFHAAINGARWQQSISNQTLESLYLLGRPFSARANGATTGQNTNHIRLIVTSPLRELSKKISIQLKTPKSPSSSESTRQSTAVLARPLGSTASSSSSSSNNQRKGQKYPTTTPSSFDYNNNQLSNDQHVDDLMMADSSTSSTKVTSGASKKPHQQTPSVASAAGGADKPAEVHQQGSNQNQNHKHNNHHQHRQPTISSWLKNNANQMAQGYFQDSFRDLLTLSQLPILSSASASTAPSELEPGGKRWLASRQQAAQQGKGNRTLALDDILRYAYIFGTGVKRKRDPLKVLGPTDAMTFVNQRHSLLASNQKPNQMVASGSSISSSSSSVANQETNRQFSSMRNKLGLLLGANKNAKPRGVMWDMATDPSLAVTVFHLLERASVALPLGFLLMPFVQMIRNPLNGFYLGRILPARASHRSVDYEELAKRIDMMDKILSRALRQTHREAPFVGR